jgi:hypothetical protein
MTHLVEFVWISGFISSETETTHPRMFEDV